MGVYDVVHVEEDCGRCGERARREIQFKLEGAWLRDYELGDQLDELDDRLGEGLWVALGAADRCGACGADDEDYDRAVWIDDGRVVAVTRWPDAFSHNDELQSTGTGLYMRAKAGWRPGRVPGE